MVRSAACLLQHRLVDQWILEQDWSLTVQAGHHLPSVRVLAEAGVGEVVTVRIILVDVQFCWLGELYLECAAAAVDITSVQILLHPPRRVQTVKLQHGLHSVLSEDDDSQQFSEG